MQVNLQQNTEKEKRRKGEKERREPRNTPNTRKETKIQFVERLSSFACSDCLSSFFRLFRVLRGLLILLFSFSPFLLFFAITAKAELRGGAAKVDMTPDVKANAIPLGGYAARKAARATGVHDPVYARALALSDGKTTAVVVSLDLCFAPASIKAEVVKRLKANGNGIVDAAHLFLAATHTHTAPDPLAMHTGNTFTHLKGWTVFDQKLLDFTADKIAQAIMQAGKDMVPVRIGIATQNAIGANRNRRNDPTVDPAFTTLKVTRIADGKTLAAVVNFAAHPTLYDDKMMEISADWPGVMTGDVETAGQKGDAGGAKRVPVPQRRGGGRFPERRR